MRQANPRDLDMPCFEQWAPRVCRTYDQRAPVDHVCRASRAFPHVCQCTACGDRNALGTLPWLVLASCPKCRPLTGYYCTAHR